jgi:outer membrane protein OmpA-like peptidoglycan-associated protein
MTTICKPRICLSSWLILLVLLSWQRVHGQNLVPNPSFEDVNICSELHQPCSPSAWFFLSRRLTTGYFPRYPSATGERYLQMVAASRETVNRQYWETMLLCPLQSGEKYVVSLKIASPANATQLSTKCPNLRDIGLWFTSRFVFVQGDSLLQPGNYLSFSGATTTDLKNGWFEIKKEFVPTSARSILIVGNFARAANADILDQRNWAGPSIDILVDDISVVPAKGNICANSRHIKDSLYAITRRHSDHIPGESDSIPGSPGVADAPPVKDVESGSPPPGTGVTRDPLFGPEPRRRADTPKAALPTTDTIIIRAIQFDFDKYLMQNPDTLQRYRSLLTRPEIKKIKVVGFTDDVGSEAYNLDLSNKRAREIARLLAEKFDLAPALIEAEGRGISRVYPTRDLNRRVEIYIFH